MYRYWVIKVNGETGEVIWEKTYGDVSANNAREIKQGPDGRYYAIGLDRPTQGPTNRVAYVVCIDPATGNAIWEKGLNDMVPESWFGYTLDFDPNGHLFVQSLVDTSPGALPTNFYLGVSKLDTSGNILCQEIISNGHDNDIFDGTATPDGGYIAVGSANPEGIDYDVILIKTDPNCLVSTIPLDLKPTGGVSAYPNPGSQQCRLVFQSSATGDVFINVLTASGRQVGSYVSQKNGDEWSMDISTANWVPGAYLIEASCGKVRSTTVWVKH